MSIPLHDPRNNNNKSNKSNKNINSSKHDKSTGRRVFVGDRPTKRQRRDNPSTPLDNVSLECVATPRGPILTPIQVSTLDKEIILTRIEKEIVQPFQLKLSVPRTRTINQRQECIQQQDGDNNSIEAMSKRMIPLCKSLARRILDSRCHIGINSCTRMIELSSQTLQPTTTTTASPSPTTATTNSPKSMLMVGDNTCRVSLILACRDIHPPTTHAHVPFLVSQQQKEEEKERKGATEMDAPVLLLFPGKGSLELGRALGIKKCSILCFTSRNMELEGLREGLVDNSEEVDKYHAKIDSFVEFCKSKMQFS
jgi:hypothetical protein